MKKVVCGFKLIIVDLEGDFRTHTRPKTAIMLELQRNIMSKMQWMDCKVSARHYEEKLGGHVKIFSSKLLKTVSI